jgi:hypothetical protein
MNPGAPNDYTPAYTPCTLAPPLPGPPFHGGEGEDLAGYLRFRSSMRDCFEDPGSSAADPSSRCSDATNPTKSDQMGVNPTKKPNQKTGIGGRGSRTAGGTPALPGCTSRSRVFTNRLGHCDDLPSATRRYSRLTICATSIELALRSLITSLPPTPDPC